MTYRPSAGQLPPPEPHLLLEKPRRKSRLALVLIVTLAIFALIAVIGIIERAVAAHDLAKRTQASAVQKVTTIHAEAGQAIDTVTLPGTIEAWHSAVIYARVPGYLKQWNVDIGAHVTKGQVLAEIDTPDLDAQYRQAKADLGTAQANNALAQVTAKRWVELLKSDSVSRQDADSKVAAANADAAMVASAQANLEHLQEEEDFKRVVAPFDGTITQRSTDVGSLINGGNTGSSTVMGQNLFQIADTSRLRVYVQVPETYTGAVRPDLHADIHVPQHPGQSFPATLSRSANALDPTTRTVQIELEIDNATGDLFAGGYADVAIKVPAPYQSVILPVNALLFRDGMKAGVITRDQANRKNDAQNDDNKDAADGNSAHVALRSVKIGKDYGKTVQIIDGIKANDEIVVNPPDSLEDGQAVEVVQPKADDQGKEEIDRKGANADSKDGQTGQPAKPADQPGDSPAADNDKTAMPQGDAPMPATAVATTAKPSEPAAKPAAQPPGTLKNRDQPGG